jgi:L-lactate dehydrogenase complex protein LldG
MTDARSAILARIRDIAQDTPAPRSHTYRTSGTLSAEARLDLFCERVSDYRAEVHRVPSTHVAETITEACAAKGVARITAPAGWPDAWRPQGVELVEDNDLSALELDALDGIVTGCTIAIAETGTIALSAGPREGRRSLTLIPDVHICIIHIDQIVETVPEAMRLLAHLVRTERRPLTLISGPSATSDIELSRVEGVHGPRNLVVIVTELRDTATA